MAAWVCTACSTTYSVGAPCCPHCRSTEYEEDGSMPKITRHEGPSVWQGEDGPELVDLPEGTIVHPVEGNAEGGEQPSPGNSSSASAVKPQTNDEPSSPSGQKPARTTASRSKKGRTASSTAPSTGGGRTGRTSAADEESS